MKKKFLAVSGTLTTAAVLVAVSVAFDLDPNKSAPKQADGPRLTVEKFADAPEVKNITAICFDDKGDLYITETNRFRRGVEDNRNHRYWLMEDIKSESSDDRRRMLEKWELQLGPGYFTEFEERILRLRDTDENGVADEIGEFAAGFDDMLDGPAIGIIAGEGKIYMACIPNIWLLEDTTGDGVADKREVFQDGFGPKVSLSGHDLHGLVWGPDGKLYFSIGDRGFNLITREGNKLKDVNSGAIFRCDADGSNLEIFFHQLRNPQEIAFNEYGDLFTVDNNSDQGDEARICYLIEGGNAGWTIGNQHLTTFKDDIEDAGLGEQPFWLTEGLWKPQFEAQPKWIIPPLYNLTNGPAGLVYDSGIALPGRYEKGHFLVCDYKGSAAQSYLWSFQVEREGAGYKVADPHIFFAGVTNTDVTLGPDSKIYLADYGGGWRIPDRGAIYSIYHKPTHKKDVVKETEVILRSDIGKMEIADLAGQLAHPDMRVRQRAQFELVKREDGLSTFKRIAADTEQPLFARIHATWGIRQNGDARILETLLDDAEPEIQAQAVRALGDLHHSPAFDRIIGLLKSDAPRVQVATAIAASKIARHDAKVSISPEALAIITGFIEKSGEDPYLRHAGMMALRTFAEDFKLDIHLENPGERFQFFVKHESKNVRLAALLAARHEKSTYVVEFLRDPDLAIAEEAVRAANDIDFDAQWAGWSVSEWSNFKIANHLADYTREIVSSRLEKVSYPVFLRLLNSCLYAQGSRHADTLLQIAESANLSKRHRMKSLKTLQTYMQPPPIDPTMGVYRPLSVNARLGNLEPMRNRLITLIDGDDARISSEAMKAASHLGMAPDEEKLIAWALDEKKPVSIRLTSIQLLAALKGSDATKVALLAATEFIQPPLRAVAITSLATVAPDALITGARSVLSRETVSDRRAAYAALAVLEDSASAELLAADLEKLIDGSLRRELELDLYEAATARTEPAVTTKVEALMAKLAAEEKTDASFTLFGGNPVQGENVFNNQGTCLKCHIIGRMGGETGPELTTIAIEREREHLFESLINPNAEIAEGYGICSVTLNDDTVIAGSPLNETSRHLTLKTAEAEPQKIAKSDIADRTETISPMPPMGLVLPRQDLRDLIAYLVSLNVLDEDE